MRVDAMNEIYSEGDSGNNQRGVFQGNLVALVALVVGMVLASTTVAIYAAVFKCEDRGKVVYSETKCAENAQVLSTGKADVKVEEHGNLTLYLNANHAYTTQGYVNETPVTFVVDTGASTTAISLRAAVNAGVKTCFGSGFTATAGGVIRTCSVTIPRLAFGMFHLRDVTVNIVPSLPVDGLLGMNVLSHMKINQQEGVMFISN